MVSVRAHRGEQATSVLCWLLRAGEPHISHGSHLRLTFDRTFMWMCASVFSTGKRMLMRLVTSIYTSGQFVVYSLQGILKGASEGILKLGFVKK